MAHSRKQSSHKPRPHSVSSPKEEQAPRKGFSALEVLLAVGIVAATVSVSVPLYQSVQADTEVTTAAEHIVQALRDAKTYSQAGKADAAWGVYVPQATVFAGEAFALRDPSYDMEFVLPPTIDTAGLDEIVFSRIDGQPSATGLIRVTSSHSNKYRDIIVDNNGFISLGKLLVLTDDENGGDASSVTSAASSGAGGGYSSAQNSSNAGGGVSSSSQSQSTSAASAGNTGGATSSAASATFSSQANSLSSTSSVASAGASSSVQQNTSSLSSSGGSGTGGGNDDAPSCDTSFSLNGESLSTVGTNDVRIRVLGSQITYGANGPRVSVRVSTTLPFEASRQRGTPAWTDLFQGSAINGNEEQVIRNVPADSPILLRFNGRYSSLFNRTYQSDANDGHVVMLKNGDRPPDYAPFGNQRSLASFLQTVIGQNGRIAIGPKDVLFIVELGSLDSNADFQDAVILVTFIEKPLTCVANNKPRLKLHFERVDNSGDGDARPVSYVGPEAVPFANNQWIPLVDAANNVIVDGGIVKDVPGIAVERGNGWVKILSYGSNRNGKEIVDIDALFVHAVLTSIQNDTGVDATENPTDGIVNDTAIGDEFIPGPNVKSMTFSTRVTRENDAVILHWAEGNPGNASSSSSSTSLASSAMASSTPLSPDVCTANFSLTDGVVITQEKADVTLRILGSAATYGENGPAASVRARISFDGGTTWQALFRSRALRGGEIAVFRNVPAGSRIVLEYEGRYSWLMREVSRSHILDGHFVALRSGDALPDVPKIKRRSGLRTFLYALIGADGRARASSSDVLFLTEFNAIDAKADYQDVVTQLSIEKSTSNCSGTSASASVSSSASSSLSSSAGVSSSQSSSSSSQNAAGSRDTDGDGVKDSNDLCFNSAIPESVPTEYLGFDRYALTDSTKLGTLSIFRYGPTKRIGAYTIEHTRGCTCSQLLDVIEEKQSYRFQEFPTVHRLLKGLFAFYVTNARKFGCGSAIIRMVDESRDD